MPADAFFIGPPGSQVACRLNRPSSGLVRDAGVLLCHSISTEYYRSYRTLARLAERLSELGFPVLRFDYPGTGDSECEPDEVSLADWINSVRQAANELRNRAGVSQLILIGLRFGATLASIAAQGIDRINTLVLWDPVTDGAAYLDRLRHLHQEMLRDTDRFRRPRRASDTNRTELLGAVYSDILLNELANIDTGSLLGVATDHTVVLSARNGMSSPAGSESHLTLEQDYGWEQLERLEEAIIDPAAIRQLSQHLRMLHP